MSQLGASRKKFGRIRWGCSEGSSSSSGEDSLGLVGGICGWFVVPGWGGSNRLIGFADESWFLGGGGGGGGGVIGGDELSAGLGVRA